jgi:hypothetical protein
MVSFMSPSHRGHWLLALPVLLGGILLLGAHASDFVGPPAPSGLEPQDPFSIRRVVASKEDIAQAISRARDGEWQRMPRVEFENLTRAAAQGGRTAGAPRLIESRYRAKLTGDAGANHSLEGSAEWKIVNNDHRPGLMKLDSLGIAIASARWTNNRNAVLGLIEPISPPGLALLVEERGEHSLALDWSSRGVVTPGELRFDLAVPISPIASMELDLPSDYVPVMAQDETLLEGPFPHSDDTNRRIWRIAFGGLSHLEISLRKVSDHQSRSPLLTNLTSRYELTTEAVLSQFTFEYQAVRGDVSTIILEHGEELTPTDVTVLNLGSWRSLPSASDGKRLLEVRLSEPARGGQLRIAARSSLPLNESKLWTAPAMRIVGAVNRTEILRIRIPADLKLVEWRNGAFQLSRVEQSAGSSTMVFEPALVPDGMNPSTRPAARLLIAGTDYRVRQNLIWGITASKSTLESRLDFEVQHGALYQLEFRLPSGAVVDKVDVEPKDLGASWSVKPGANPQLQIDLNRPLTPGMEGHATVNVRLPDVGERLNSRTIDFPDLIPLGALRRSGEYQIRVDSAFRAVAPPSSRTDDLVGPTIPDPGINSSKWIYRFHGQPPVGPLVLVDQPARFNASVDHFASLEGAHLRTTARVEVRSEQSSQTSILLYISEPLDNRSTWRIIQGANQLLAVEPLEVGSVAAITGAIGMTSPVGAACRMTQLARGHWWRLSFARSLSGLVVLEGYMETTGPAPTLDDGPIRIPLVGVFGAAQLQRTLRIRTSSSSSVQIRQSGMIRETQRFDHPGVETYYRITGSAAFAELDLDHRDRRSAPLHVDAARLISVVHPSTDFRCWYAFRVRGGQSSSLPISLMAGSKVLAVAVAGRLLRPEQILVENGSASTKCSISTPAGDIWHMVEILFEVPTSKWRLTTQFAPPIPLLPVQPDVVRVEWRLPPDLAPINPVNWVRLPGSAERMTKGPVFAEHPMLVQTPTVFSERSEAARIMPNPKGTQPRTVQQALANPGSGADKPLIDMIAFAEANVRETTPMPIGGWESLGLTAVSFPGGAVLTTPRQLTIWEANGNAIGVSSSVQLALQEAIRHGRDSSGRFRTAADWLESLPSSDAVVLLTSLGGDETGWTAWEWQGAAAVDLEVANTRDLSILGWLVAALLAATGILLIGRLGRTGVVLLMLWLLVSGLALRWLLTALSGLAYGPMLAGLVVALISVCRARPAKKTVAKTAIMPATPSRRIAPGLITGTTTALLLVLTGTAAAPDDPTVYLLAGTAEDPEPKTVYASSDLIARLKHLANPKPAVCNYAFTKAIWSGSGEANSADFEASLQFYSFVERVTVELPVGDTRLREMLLDGAVAFPKSAGPGRVTLDVEGRGEHRIDLKLTASIVGIGPDRELRFTVPEAPITGLTFKLPTGFEKPQAINWQGAQRVSTDGKLLRADLGRTKSIHLRWHQAGASGKAQIRLQEAAVWDLNRSSSTLLAAFDYRVIQGSVQLLKIALPANVQVGRLEIRTDSASAAFAPSWIRDWSAGPDHVLTVELQAALTGSFQLLLESVSIHPSSNRPALQFPAALNVSESETYVAYRLRGFESPSEIERRGVTDFSADSFLKDIWRPANAEQAPAPITRAYRQAKNQSAFVRPLLVHVPSAVQANQELTWQLGPRGGDLRCVSRWLASTEPLTFVEWDVPAAIAIHDVRGLNVHSWIRLGSRVQVWLREPAQDVSLAWHGSLRRTGPATETIIYDLPAVRIDGARSATTLLRVRAPEGWALSGDNPGNLGVPVAAAVDREVAMQAPKASLPARFILRGLQADAAIRSVSIAEVVDRRLRVATHIEANLRPDRLHSIVLNAGDSTGWDVVVDGPSNSRVVPGPVLAESREWVIDIPAGDSQRNTFTVTMSRALSSTQQIELPAISVMQGERPIPIQRWIALIGPELRVPDGKQHPVKEKPEVVLFNYPRELSAWRERGGTLWTEPARNSSLQILAAPTSLSTAPSVQIELIDIETIRIGQQWICRAAVDLVHEQGAILECVMPPDCRLAGIAVDGLEQFVQAGSERIPIALPFAAGPRLLQLVWTTSTQTWEPPIFVNNGKQLQNTAVLWSAAAQQSERIEVGSAESAALHNLRRADALLRMATDPESVSWPDASRQRLLARASRWARLADPALSGPRSSIVAAERGPNGISVTEWATRMREQAQSLRGSRAAPTGDTIRETTFGKMPFAGAFQTGMPIRWSTSSEMAASDVSIRRGSPWTPFPALATFGLIVVAVGLLGTLMLMLGRQTRPEQAAVLGLIGAAAFGPIEGVVFLGLTLLALVVRAAWTGKRIYGWLGG